MYDDPEDWYGQIGEALGAIAGVITFIGSWIYAIASSGFVLGVGLGWLPALICSGVAAAIVRYLWGLFAVGVVLLLLNYWQN